MSVAVALLALGGCTEQESAGPEVGYVSGKGVVTVLAPEQRERPGALEGETLDGERVSLSDFAGKTVVVNVWGSWCPPCRAEAPELVAAAEDLADDGVVFLGVNSRDPDPSKAQAFVRRFDVPYPSLYDQQGTALLAFSDTLPAKTIPSTIVVDSQGRVAARVLGEVSRSTLVGIVEEVRAG